MVNAKPSRPKREMAGDERIRFYLYEEVGYCVTDRHIVTSGDTIVNYECLLPREKY